MLSRVEAAVPSGCQRPKMGIALRLGRFMPKPTRLGLTQVITGGAQGVSAGYRRRTLVARSHFGAWETVPSGCPIGSRLVSDASFGLMIVWAILHAGVFPLPPAWSFLPALYPYVITGLERHGISR